MENTGLDPDQNQSLPWVPWMHPALTSFDNTIITEYDIHSINPSNFNVYADSNISAKYCILGNALIGTDKYAVLSESIPEHATWLDTIADNGGLTPTAKLKDVFSNPAKSKGNPLYIGSKDQRGIIRADSVSIGAYQWVRPTSITVSPKQATLCLADSITISVSILPVFASDTSFTVSSSDTNIVQILGSKLYAKSPGLAKIIVHSNDAGLTDTCEVVVLSPAELGAISGSATVCKGQNEVTYSVPANSGISNYVWTLPDGFSGTSVTNSITVNVGPNASSGLLRVKGVSGFCQSSESSIFITVDPLPLPTISGDNKAVVSSDGIEYHTEAGHTDYMWNLSEGGTIISGTASSTVTIRWEDIGTHTITVNYKNANGCSATNPTSFIVDVMALRTLNLNVFIEGLFDGGSKMRKAQNAIGDQFFGDIADVVTVELHNASNYEAVEFIDNKVSINTSGVISMSLSANLNGLYYITIKQRNSIEISSAIPVSFNSGVITYSFDSFTKVYGGVMKFVAGKYCMYAGDINQDGQINTDDLNQVFGSASIFSKGYLPQDVNADGVIDAMDIIILDNNMSKFVTVSRP